MWQKAFTILAAASGLFCVAVLGAWFGLHGYSSQVCASTWHERSGIRVIKLMAFEVIWDEFRFTHDSYADELDRGPVPSGHVVFLTIQIFLPFSPLNDTLLGRSGFGYSSQRFTRSPKSRALWSIVSQTEVPEWFVALVLAVLPTCWLVRKARAVRRGRRVAAGLCVTCGYDLRASIDRCPECGAAIGGSPAAA